MNGAVAPLGGAVTIGLIVILGTLVYPWLLARRHGVWIVGLTTLLLAAMFTAFQGYGSSPVALAIAAGWALGPVIAGVVVYRIERKSAQGRMKER